MFADTYFTPTSSLAKQIEFWNVTGEKHPAKNKLLRCEVFRNADLPPNEILNESQVR